MAPLSIKVLGANEFNLEEPEETGVTFQENAFIKAHHGFMKTGLPTLSDDSGLCIPQLNGNPGIYSARWIKAAPDYGRLRQELTMVGIRLEDPTPAFFKTVLCFRTNESIHYFEGTVHGTLRFPPKGNHGFGYDPLFTPEGSNRTFAEMEPREKKELSHRSQAFSKFLSYLSNK